jgi:hypothetical protein
MSLLSKFPALCAGILALLVIGCGGSTEPVADPIPTKLTLLTAPSTPVRSRLSLTPQPVVQLRDARDAAVEQAGTVVTVSIAGDALLRGTTAATTSTTGAATFSDLSIAGSAGEKTLTFSAPGLASVVVNVTLTSGLPQSLAAVDGSDQFAEVGAVVAVPPRVSILDSDGNGVSGVAVAFAIDSGGGLISGATQTTDPAGIATLGSWTLGPLPGANTITASVAELPAAAITFRAIGISIDPCRRASSVFLALEVEVSGALEAQDCAFHGGQFHDFFNFTLSAQQAVVISVRSADYDPTVDLFTLADQRDRGALQDTVNARRNVSLKAILAPGRYETAASSVPVGETGPYTLRISAVTPAAESCEIVFVVRGISTEQELSSTDCVDGSGLFYGDIFDLWLDAGERVRLTQAATQLVPQVLLYRYSGDLVAVANGLESGTAVLDYEAKETGKFFVVASSARILESGAYRLSLSDPGGSRIAAFMEVTTGRSSSSHSDLRHTKPGIRDRYPGGWDRP